MTEPEADPTATGPIKPSPVFAPRPEPGPSQPAELTGLALGVAAISAIGGGVLAIGAAAASLDVGGGLLAGNFRKEIAATAAVDLVTVGAGSAAEASVKAVSESKAALRTVTGTTAVANQTYNVGRSPGTETHALGVDAYKHPPPAHWMNRGRNDMGLYVGIAVLGAVLIIAGIVCLARPSQVVETNDTKGPDWVKNFKEPAYAGRTGKGMVRYWGCTLIFAGSIALVVGIIAISGS